jgi:hypothetical protein
MILDDLMADGWGIKLIWKIGHMMIIRLFLITIKFRKLLGEMLLVIEGSFMFFFACFFFFLIFFFLLINDRILLFNLLLLFITFKIILLN